MKPADIETLIQSFLEELADRLVAKASFAFGEKDVQRGTVLMEIATAIDDIFDDDDETEH